MLDLHVLLLVHLRDDLGRHHRRLLDRLLGVCAIVLHVRLLRRLVILYAHTRVRKRPPDQV
jgi:hypothetical protein